MGWDRAYLKSRGKTAFKANYWKCVLVALILSVVVGGGGSGNSASSRNRVEDEINHSSDIGHIYSNEFTLDGASALNTVVGAGITSVVMFVVFVVLIGVSLIDILAFNPLQVGCQNFFIKNAHSGDPALGLIGSGFKRYSTVVVTMFLRDLFTFLWTLLLIIPGIVKSYEYRMIPYLLAEYPDMSREEAFRRSKEMMDGQKWEAFVLDLSFIGWNILSALTFGLLGIFYVEPYRHATNAELYLALNDQPAYRDPYQSY